MVIKILFAVVIVFKPTRLHGVAPLTFLIHQLYRFLGELLLKIFIIFRRHGWVIFNIFILLELLNVDFDRNLWLIWLIITKDFYNWLLRLCFLFFLLANFDHLATVLACVWFAGLAFVIILVVKTQLSSSKLTFSLNTNFFVSLYPLYAFILIFSPFEIFDCFQVWAENHSKDLIFMSHTVNFFAKYFTFLTYRSIFEFFS